MFERRQIYSSLRHNLPSNTTNTAPGTVMALVILLFIHQSILATVLV